MKEDVRENVRCVSVKCVREGEGWIGTAAVSNGSTRGSSGKCWNTIL